MAGHFRTLLEGIVADPDRRISDFSILTEAERHQLLVEWNDTAADYPKDKCIHELFEEQANRTPDAIAVEFEEQRLTYSELNIRANQLAHHLISFGVGPERLVGICVERSIEMVVGLLGILKAGGAYVPLDPSYPKERLAFMLEDSQVSVVVTQEKYLESGQRSAVNGRPTHVCIDRDGEVINRESGNNVNSGVKTNNLAYVIYTSGSTGQPKGVAIEHRNASNLLYWAKTVYSPRDLEIVLASTSICFDLTVFELFVPLSWGGKVLLVNNALCLAHEAGPREITLVNTVPSVMATVLSAGRLPDTVRVVNLAGEPLRPELVKQIYDFGLVERVHDLYGPSETTTYSTFMLRTGDGPATIGRPISNTQVYILDSHLQPVPIGVPGELYIGGTGVARGYLNRPELTAERFIRNPFSDELASRLYRTGDLARYRADGNIEFLGRTDRQVKVRGYRIEIGEIEAALNQHPAVKDSVVMSRVRESLTEDSLIGYVVPKQQPVPSVAALRGYLKEKLPGYMIPSMFIPLAELPLTPNGKTDRSRLPAPNQSFTTVGVSPRTEIEELVAQIWRDVLKIEAIGVHDNFFDLGGHSLLAIQIISKVREAFDKEVELSALFDTPTIAGLAATIEKTINGRSHDLPPITRAPRDGPLPLSMNQEHLWRLDQMIPGTHCFNMPYVYRLTGSLNFSALERTLEEIIRRHEALRTVFGEVDGRPVQIIKDIPYFQLPYFDLRRVSADEVSQKSARFILEEREGPFDLKSGPLIRVKLLQVTMTDYLLLVTMHHIISDYWSMQIFRSELTKLYEAFLLGRPSPLPEPTIQFADYACWERLVWDGDLLDERLIYWRQMISGPAIPLAHGQDYPDEKEADSMRVRRPVHLDGASFAALRTIARKKSSTSFMVLIAALNIFLFNFTGQSDIRVGVLVANRRNKMTESVIGYFLNTVILCTRLSPEMTFSQVLRQVKNAVLAAHVQHSIPFECLVKMFKVERTLEPNSLFRVLVNHQTHSPKTTDPFEVTITALNLRSITPEAMLTASDLVVELTESSTEFTGSVNIRSGIFSEDDVGIAERLCVILKQMASWTEQPISSTAPGEMRSAT
jgi:amino acid adenylation domain-containing protein